MKPLSFIQRFSAADRRLLIVAALSISLLLFFLNALLKSGPAAPIAVTVALVENRSITPMLFGVGTIEARHTHRIGPTYAGRLKSLDVDIGDHVTSGQILGEMDPVDLDNRIRSQELLHKRAVASLGEMSARHAHASSQYRRYEQLHTARVVSDEALSTKRQEMAVAETALISAQEDVARSVSDRDALKSQRSSLRLVSPANGIVSARDVDPGTTVVPGQSIVEIVDPEDLWINVRFDQVSTIALSTGSAAKIALRSRGERPVTGYIRRIEPKADAITEEMLAKVAFDEPLRPPPSIGELAEISVAVSPLPPALTIPNAALRHHKGAIGVWRLAGTDIEFVPVKPGRSDLDGLVQIESGLRERDEVIVHSEKNLNGKSRVRVVSELGI